MSDNAIKYLNDVPYCEIFRTRCGAELKNLDELALKLNDMPNESFVSHVNPQKNDFANWVRHSVKDETLANELEKVLDIESTKKAVEERIDELKKRVHMAEIIRKLNLLTIEKMNAEKCADAIEVAQAVKQDIEKPEDGLNRIEAGLKDIAYKPEDQEVSSLPVNPAPQNQISVANQTSPPVDQTDKEKMSSMASPMALVVQASDEKNQEQPVSADVNIPDAQQPYDRLTKPDLPDLGELDIGQPEGISYIPPIPEAAPISKKMELPPIPEAPKKGLFSRIFSFGKA